MALKQKVIEFTEKDRNKVEKCKFGVSEVNIYYCRYHHNSIYFSLKTTSRCFMGANKRIYPKVDEAMFCAEMCKERLPFKMSSNVSKARKIAKF